MNLSELRKKIKTLQAQEVPLFLTPILRNENYAPEEYAMLGKTLLPILAAHPQALNVTLLGQCTTLWLAHHLAAQGIKENQILAVHDTEYDTVLQSLFEIQDGTSDFFVFLAWNQRLIQRIRKGDSSSEIIEQELAFWRQVWQLAQQKGGRIIQAGYDFTGCGPLGFHCSGQHSGEIHLLRKMNEAVQQALPDGAFFIDLEVLSSFIGKQTFYSARQYYWTKQPFSETGTMLLAQRIANAVRVMRTGSKKVLVLDLDNTLWGGVVGDLGANGIELGEGPEGEAFRDFQAYCKQLTQRGILLAVASKNDEVNAKEPFQVNPNMVLTLDDIVSFHAHWSPKSQSMKAIAAELNLGIDSLVFFDDNPAEREEVRQNAPEVSVVDVPDDPSNYIAALEQSLFFETLHVTAADAQRTKQYLVESKRKELEQSFTNLDDYLTSLEMTGKIAPINDGNIQRVVQLLGKTNQFNATTKRHDEAAVRQLLALPGAFGLTLELSDKFSDLGLIAVAIGVPDDGRLLLDTFLMSCRVLNRTAEHFFMNALAEQAQQNGFETLIGEYIPTAKNGLVKDLYPSFGFEPLKPTQQTTEESATFSASVSQFPLKTFIRKVSAAEN